MPLSGRFIGTPDCYQQDGLHEYTNAFDDNTETSCNYTEPYGGWTENGDVEFVGLQEGS